MEIYPDILAKMLFVAFLFGVQSGVVFDIGRALRAWLFGEVKSKRLARLYSARRPFFGGTVGGKDTRGRVALKNILMFFCDLFWVVYSFFGVVLINYAYNEGGVRAFTVFGAIAGFVIYYFTVSKIVIFLTEFVAFLLRFSYFALFGAMSFPFCKIYNKIHDNLVKKVKKSLGNIRLHLEKRHKM